MEPLLLPTHPSTTSPFKSTAASSRPDKTSSSPTRRMIPTAQRASPISAEITSRTSPTNSVTSRLRTTQLLRVGRIRLTATPFASISQNLSPTSAITTQPQAPFLTPTADLIPLASKMPSPSMSMVAISTPPTTRLRQMATAFASTSITSTHASTRGKPSPSPTTSL